MPDNTSAALITITLRFTDSPLPARALSIVSLNVAEWWRHFVESTIKYK